MSPSANFASQSSGSTTITRSYSPPLSLTLNSGPAFDKASHLPEGSELTPAVGTEFPESFQVADLLDGGVASMEKIEEISRLIATRGVVFFRNQQNLPASLLTKFANLLHKSTGIAPESNLHIHPLEESVFGEMGEVKNIGAISNLGDEGRRISQMDNEKSKLSSSNWHTDISFEPVPADFSLLHMHTIPPSGGDTLYSSQYAAYDRLSPRMKEMLDGMHAVHDAQVFREQALKYGFELYSKPRGNDLNVGGWLQSIHPVVRTHPITGWKTLFVNKGFTRRIEELNPDESDLVLNYLFALNKDNHDLQCRFRWGKDDLAVWDNRAVQHSATFDYGNTPRAGDRVVSVGEKPFFDPNSKSQAEALALNKKD